MSTQNYQSPQVYQDPIQSHRALFQPQYSYPPQIIPPPNYPPQQAYQQQQWQQQQQIQPQVQQQQGQPQQQVQQQQSIPTLRCFPVNNRVEAEGFTIDAFGVYVFPDLVNKKIYTKQINDNGLAVINSYALEIKEEIVKEEIKAPSVVITEDILNNLRTELEQKISSLTDKYTDLELKLKEKEGAKDGHTGNNGTSARTKNLG